MAVEVLSAIAEVQVIASGTAIRELQRLVDEYGPGRWRKLKGIATVRESDGKVNRAEIHWYEAHGVGKFEFKVKRYVH